MVEGAKGGDMRAADILLRRLWPERKGRPVDMDLPPLEGAARRRRGAGRGGGGGGRRRPIAEEGQPVAAVLETQRRAIETAEPEARIAALERRAEKGKTRRPPDACSAGSAPWRRRGPTGSGQVHRVFVPEELERIRARGRIAEHRASLPPNDLVIYRTIIDWPPKGAQADGSGAASGAEEA